MRRLALTLAIAGLLAASPSAAAAPELRYEPRTSSAGDDAVVIIGDADRLDVEISIRMAPTIPVVADHDVSSARAFASRPTQCNDAPGTELTDLDCDPPADFTEVTGSPEGDAIAASCAGSRSGSVPDARLEVDAGLGDDEVSSGCGSTVDLGSGNDAASMRSGRSTIHGGDGSDDISGGVSPDRLHGDAGNDRLRGSNANDLLEGGEGNDVLDGGVLSDTLDGGPGRDLLIGGPHTDVIDGGDGPDTASYEDRDGSVTLSISLNALADDGESGENDRIGASVENVIGSLGVDSITGDPGFNAIDGGAGGDLIDPGAGTDFVDTGPGNDRVQTRDGFPDVVACGSGDDLAITDEFDVASGCETLLTSRELMPDVDNDGVPAPADCADHEPAFRPGVPDAPDNTVDENCDGSDAVNLDRDNDGAARPADCNDADTRVRPGLPDRPGNGLDENCEGGDAPFPRILTPVQSGFRVFPTFTTVSRLRVVDVPAGAVIELRCRGGAARGCFPRVLRRRVPQGTARVNLLKLVRGDRFKPLSVLEVRITLPETIGKVVTFTMRPDRVRWLREGQVVLSAGPLRR